MSKHSAAILQGFRLLLRPSNVHQFQRYGLRLAPMTAAFATLHSKQRSELQHHRTFASSTTFEDSNCSRNDSKKDSQTNGNLGQLLKRLITDDLYANLGSRVGMIAEKMVSHRFPITRTLHSKAITRKQEVQIVRERDFLRENINDKNRTQRNKYIPAPRPQYHWVSTLEEDEERDLLSKLIQKVPTTRKEIIKAMMMESKIKLLVTQIKAMQTPRPKVARREPLRPYDYEDTYGDFYR